MYACHRTLHNSNLIMITYVCNWFIIHALIMTNLQMHEAIAFMELLQSVINVMSLVTQ